ncbi:hypothetical protein [Luteolibacter marinus]|uniref:hypothetical protein n=1 Tax=Luteolibacter marinus TaxID=2776705 RepID=UPI0018689452|nr:hypothetical protein [Luteolibacter marinus]
MKFSRLVGMALLLACGPLSAQEGETTEKPKLPPRQVRFLPVGDLATYRFEERDGVQYELEPPPGSVPPREVMVGFGDEAEASAVRLLLGRITEPLKAPGGGGPMLVRRREDGAEAEPWMRVNRPEEGDFLVLLWRANPKGSWAEARSLVLPDGPTAAPAGEVRVVNLSPVPVGMVFNGEQIKLPAGKITRHRVPIGKDAPIWLGAEDVKGKLKRFHSGAVFQNRGERTLVVIYRADGDQKRLPLKAVIRREPMPQPLKKDP